MSIQQKPKISVIMKVYNAARYLEGSVNSILKQTFENFEFIIVDDGSTDSSWTVMSNLKEQDRRIILHRNMKNMGLPGTGNVALKLASGEYLAIQDADDWSYPDRLEKQVRYLERNLECVAVGGQMLVVYPDGIPLRLWRVPLSHEDIELRHINGFGLQLPHPAMMARTEALRLIGGYREEFPVADDYELLLRLGEVGKVENLPDVLVRYTRHESNTTSLKREKWSQCRHEALLQAWERRGMGIPPFKTIPNPSLRFRDGSRMVSLIIYGLKNVLRKPGSPEGWSALKGAASRLVRKWGNHKRKVS